MQISMNTDSTATQFYDTNVYGKVKLTDGSNVSYAQLNLTFDKYVKTDWYYNQTDHPFRFPIIVETTDEIINDIVVEFDGRELTPEQFNYIAQLSEILDDSGNVGELELGIFKIKINKLETYEKELIKCER